jgi:hypothetical protein
MAPSKRATKTKKSPEVPPELPVENSISEAVPEMVHELQVESAPVEPILSEYQILADRISSVLEQVTSSIKHLKTLEPQLKAIKTMYSKQKKQKMPKRKVTGNHGFTAEVKISKELAKFLKMPLDTMISRPKVTHLISNYIKENGLSNPENKSIFKTDSNLKKILGEPRFPIDAKKPELGDGFSYFNLQLYMKDHFSKKEQ